MKPRDFPTDRIKTQPSSSSAGPFSSLYGGTNWARTWFSHHVSEKTSALHEAERDAFILYCRRLGLQECLFPLPRCSLLVYCGGKKKKEKRTDGEHLRFTGDNWLPEKPAFGANENLIIVCQLLQESSVLI